MKQLIMNCYRGPQTLKYYLYRILNKDEWKFVHWIHPAHGNKCPHLKTTTGCWVIMKNSWYILVIFYAVKHLRFPHTVEEQCT